MSFLLEDNHRIRYRTHNVAQTPTQVWKIGQQVLFFLWALCAVLALIIAGSASGHRTWARRIAGSMWQGLVN